MPGFKNLRKKVRRRRIETLLLAGYAIAVTCALFVSLLNKSDKVAGKVSDNAEEYDYAADIMTPSFSDSVKDNPFEVIYAQVNNIKLLSENQIVATKYIIKHDDNVSIVLSGPSQQKVHTDDGSYEGIYQKERRVIIVSPGDTFIGILTNLGMEAKNATDAYNTLKKVYDARSLKSGQHIELTATFEVKSNKLETLDTLVIEPVRGTKYVLQINEYDQFEARVEQEKFNVEVKAVSGKISGIVSTALQKNGVPKKLVGNVTQMFAQIIDFSRDVRKGDSFEVKYEVNADKNGEVVSVGDVLYASFTLGENTYKLYRYKNRSGEVEYYDEKGGAKKTGLDKKPLAMKNARISSLFGYRRHPIYKTQKFHSGVDYAAPRGTKIFASGNGVIEMARYVNGYGNFIKIRHNSEYETAYAHMHKFASGMKPGVRVKKGQVIGYVGSTGRSTGPHLHFEIVRNGKRIDPLKAKVATGTDLNGSQLADFKRVVKKINESGTKVTKVQKVEPKKETKSAEAVKTAVTETLQKEDKTSQPLQKEKAAMPLKKIEIQSVEALQSDTPAASNKKASALGSLGIPQKVEIDLEAVDVQSDNLKGAGVNKTASISQETETVEKAVSIREKDANPKLKRVYPPKRPQKKIKSQRLVNADLAPLPTPKPIHH